MSNRENNLRIRFGGNASISLKHLSTKRRCITNAIWKNLFSPAVKTNKKYQENEFFTFVSFLIGKKLGIHLN